MRNMKVVHSIAAIVIGLLFLAFAGTLIYNTLPRKISDCPITLKVVAAKDNKATGNDLQISKNAFEDALRQSAYAARQEAQQEYDRTFSILLTIITIFGIAWPLVVAFAQYKFNEQELDKIQETDKKASTASTDAAIALNNANEASANANQALVDAQNAINENTKNTKRIESVFNSLKKTNALHWKMLTLVYSQLGVITNQLQIGDLSTHNSCIIMSLNCELQSIMDLGSANIEDVDRMCKTISATKPEQIVGACSQMNKTIVSFIKQSTVNLLKSNLPPEIKQKLEEILKMADAMYDHYTKLLPYNIKVDSNG